MAADVGRAGATGAILQQLATGDGLALLLQHLGQVVGAELAAPGQAPGGHLADALLAEAAAALAQLVEHDLLQALAAGLGDAGQQGPDLRGLRQGQVQLGDAVLEVGGQLPLAGRDHQVRGTWRRSLARLRRRRQMLASSQ